MLAWPLLVTDKTRTLAAMSIHVAIRHTTHYRFDRRVALGPHVVRLRPAPHSRTPILAYTLKITPETHFIN